MGWRLVLCHCRIFSLSLSKSIPYEENYIDRLSYWHNLCNKDRRSPDRPESKTDGHPGRRTPLFVSRRSRAVRRDAALTAGNIRNIFHRVNRSKPKSYLSGPEQKYQFPRRGQRPKCSQAAVEHHPAGVRDVACTDNQVRSRRGPVHTYLACRYCHSEYRHAGSEGSGASGDHPAEIPTHRRHHPDRHRFHKESRWRDEGRCSGCPHQTG